MSLQDIFHVVGIVTMSLLTILFITLIVVLIYIKVKIDELVNVVEKKISEIKEVISHPGRIVSAVGGAVVDTAVEKVSEMTDAGTRKKRR